MKHSAYDILKMINEMENEERLKLLDMMYDEYYNPRKNIKYEQTNDKKVDERIENLEKDVKFLTGKVGLHDLYFNRIHREERD